MAEFRRDRVRTAVCWLALLALMLLIVFPVYWVALTSLKSGKAVFALPPVWRFAPTGENYRYLF